MDRNDVVTLVGMGCLAGGLWMVYPPAALIAVGLAMIIFGILGAWRKALTPNPSPKGRGEMRALTPGPSPKGRGEKDSK